MAFTKEYREYIANMASQVREACDLSVPASEDDLKAIIERFGGSFEEKSGVDYEAKIEKIGDSFKITVSPNATRRSVFTIAHELGHLFLHMGYGHNRKLWDSLDDNPYIDSAYYRQGRSEQEYEADLFAAEFLMPERDFRLKCEEHSVNAEGSNIEKVASEFGVSRHAAQTRGKWLGIVSWDTNE